MFVRVVLTLLSGWLAFFKKSPREYTCSLTNESQFTFQRAGRKFVVKLRIRFTTSELGRKLRNRLINFANKYELCYQTTNYEFCQNYDKNLFSRQRKVRQMRWETKLFKTVISSKRRIHNGRRWLLTSFIFLLQIAAPFVLNYSNCDCVERQNVQCYCT